MNRFKLLYTLVLLLVVYLSAAQSKLEIPSNVSLSTICYSSDKIEKGFIPPPQNLDLKSGKEKKSEIIVEYSLFPAKAKEAFEYAVNIWEHIIESDIPIYIKANWRTQSQNVLGSAGPTSYYTDFKNIPHENRYYPVSVAEKISKTEITGPSNPDIVATFNKDVDWYFGTDGKTPNLMYDFVTVALHEITHGLGFTGFFFLRLSTGAYDYNETGDASAFDLLVVDQENNQLVDTLAFKIYSVDLGNALTSNALYADSPVALFSNQNKRPRLYAPTSWDDGSSIYHLNDATYGSGNENSLMTHAIGKGEAVHDPGPIATGLMYDIGWKHLFLDHSQPKDTEIAKPIVFTADIESEYQLDSTSLFVQYSYDNFENHIDSIPLQFTAELGQFSAVLNPEIETGKIDYYVIAKDELARIFTIPTEAPKILNTITIGPDNVAPEIEHKPIEFYLFASKGLQISAYTDDNLGVDTVFVEYEINGVPQTPFGLVPDSGNVYSGVFNFDPQLLNDLDEISYTITARDSATAKNLTTIPAEDKFTFLVEKIYSPTASYINDFNGSSSDLILSNFEIYTAENFQNPGLHSLHPYTSPKQNDLHFNFTATLKYPIILGSSSIMTFDEIVLVEPGEFQSKYGDDDFWDYVIVEGSTDYGESWLPLIDGYDSDDETLWETEYNRDIVGQESQAVGIPDWFVNRSINLTANNNFVPGDTILIQFRLFSDPYANGWGWVIDNLRIQTPVSSPLTTLSPGNILVYPNPVSTAFTVTVQPKNPVNELEICVFNPLGEKIKVIQNRNVSNESSYRINLENYASGMYFLSIKENGKQVLSKKIIKNQY